MIFPVQPAAAQAQPPTPQARPSTSNISDQKLDQTAAAIQNVQRVRADYQQKLSAAAPNDQNKIMSEANAALEKAVTDQGLSVDEYQSIIQVAQNDPNVHQRLAQRLSANKTK
jgi:di/tripeptidase